MIVEYSVAVIALAFVVLAVYVILTLRSARASMEEASQAISLIQQKLDQLSEESVQLVRSTHRITEDLQSKMNSANSLFQAIEQTGETVHQITSSMKQLSASVAQSVTKGKDRAASPQFQKVNEVIEWASLTINLLKKFKRS